jgi:hypothetical protein
VKRTLSILALLVLAGVASAQRDTSEFNFYRYKPRPQDRVVLEVNHTGWLGLRSELREKATSGGVNFQLFFDYPLGKSHFSFAWGGGISSYNIHGPISLVYKTDSVSGSVVFTSLEERLTPYRINRIGLKIVEVPFEFRFRTFTNYQFKFTLGFKAGYVIQSFRKTYDSMAKAKFYDIAGVNPLRYGVTARIGWEQLHLAAFYSLSEFFEKNKGTPGVVPFTIGFAYTPRISLGTR